MCIRETPRACRCSLEQNKKKLEELVEGSNKEKTDEGLYKILIDLEKVEV